MQNKTFKFEKESENIKEISHCKCGVECKKLEDEDLNHIFRSRHPCVLEDNCTLSHPLHLKFFFHPKDDKDIIFTININERGENLDLKNVSFVELREIIPSLRTVKKVCPQGPDCMYTNLKEHLERYDHPWIIEKKNTYDNIQFKYSISTPFVNSSKEIKEQFEQLKTLNYELKPRTTDKKKVELISFTCYNEVDIYLFLGDLGMISGDSVLLPINENFDPLVEDGKYILNSMDKRNQDELIKYKAILTPLSDGYLTNFVIEGNNTFKEVFLANIPNFANENWKKILSVVLNFFLSKAKGKLVLPIVGGDKFSNLPKFEVGNLVLKSIIQRLHFDAVTHRNQKNTIEEVIIVVCDDDEKEIIQNCWNHVFS
eukprot:TRINITY_DN1102_c0_g1_i1.p1 TRINITY_DN1102_c0_g1~~TRINITY_DN1102_c0_g1_i1.p1  ORF type:complete len:371 (-),score=101.00 TRINITY_DN1102_c0_g1_i1:71-1183(-)